MCLGMPEQLRGVQHTRGRLRPQILCEKMFPFLYWAQLMFRQSPSLPHIQDQSRPIHFKGRCGWSHEVDVGVICEGRDMCNAIHMVCPVIPKHSTLTPETTLHLACIWALCLIFLANSNASSLAALASHPLLTISFQPPLPFSLLSSSEGMRLLSSA